jgi:hypothetical protein
MEIVILVCLMAGAGMWGLTALMLVAVDLVREHGLAQALSGTERRQFTRVPCHFRTLAEPAGTARWAGDLSLGGACVRLPAASFEKRLKVVAVDANGLAPATTIEGRVVSTRREGELFAHHLAFEPGFDTVAVSALVAAAAWAEPPEAEAR